MSALIDIGTLITQTPGIHNGRPIITGTGVTVQRIAVWFKLGYSPEEIARKINHLSLAQIHAALAYYYANRETIDADIADENEAYEQLQHEHEVNQQKQL